MIEYAYKCDKCKQEAEPWMNFRWKDGTDSFLCKKCVPAFKKWLNESDQIMSVTDLKHDCIIWYDSERRRWTSNPKRKSKDEVEE